MTDLISAGVALVLAIIISLLLRKPAERLVKYLYSLNPRQINTLIAIEIVILIVTVLLLRKY